MFDWMLTAPAYNVSAQLERSFAQVLANRDATLLPPDVPRWVFLAVAGRAGLAGARLTDWRSGRTAPRM